MAVSISNALDLPYRIVGNQKKVVKDITFDAEYTKEGEALTRAQLGLNVIEQADATITTVKGSVNIANAKYDPTNQKIHLYDETPAEVAENANVEGVVVTVTAYGW